MRRLLVLAAAAFLVATGIAFADPFEDGLNAMRAGDFAKAAAIWRPLASQNIVGRLSAAALFPGNGFDDLFDEQDGSSNTFYSVLANIILAF